MKIYLDPTNKIIGYETVFYDKKKEKRPITDLDNGNRQWGMLLNEKQNKYIQKHLDKGGKITQLTLKKDGSLTVNKPDEAKTKGNCTNCPKTIMIDTGLIKFNSDLMRHMKDKVLYTFKELDVIPFESIDESYLYFIDKSIIEFEKNGRYQIDRSLKRFFGLFDKDNHLVSFIYLFQREIPIMMLLYQDEKYDNTGYIILYYLIELFKKEGKKYLDLGGLTREESGINQFKRKFGQEILIADRFLYSGK